MAENFESIGPREYTRQILEKCGDVRVKNIITYLNIEEPKSQHSSYDSIQRSNRSKRASSQFNMSRNPFLKTLSIRKQASPNYSQQFDMDKGMRCSQEDERFNIPTEFDQ